MIYIQYLIYILRHKWYVFVECCKLGVPWRGITHDLSKLYPDEFFPYLDFFYRKKKKTTGCYDPSQGNESFNRAWLKHIHRNPHHWQYWLLTQDDDPDMILDMPMRYRKEMLADWMGAGKAQGYGDNTANWYAKHCKKIKIHPDTRYWIENQLNTGGLR